MKIKNILCYIGAAIMILIGILCLVGWTAPPEEYPEPTIKEELDSAISKILDELHFIMEQRRAKNVVQLSNEMYQSVTSYEYTNVDAVYLAKTIYGEAGFLDDYEKSLVAWCVLNRVDKGTWGNTVGEVVSAAGQFDGYSNSKPVTEENYELALDVLERWEAEKKGEEDVGRTLPAEYDYFVGDGNHNYFRDEYLSTESTYQFGTEGVYDR